VNARRSLSIRRRAVGTVSGAGRRRWLAAATVFPLLAATAPAARAAARPVPQPLLDLGSAATKLFNAAESGSWETIQAALATVQAAVERVRGAEKAYAEAGGPVNRFFEAGHYLEAEMVDARAAASVRDRPWLVSTADNILSRVGDLTAPFADGSDQLLPQAEALLFLTRRMRRALAWDDADGMTLARRDFDRLWKRLRGEVASQAPAKVRSVDAALGAVARARTVASLRALAAAVRGLLEALA